MMFLLTFDCKVIRRIFVLIIGTLIMYCLTYEKHLFGSNKIVSSRSTIEQNRNNRLKHDFNLSANVHVVDLTAPITAKFRCIKTNKILHNLSPPHSKKWIFVKKMIFEIKI